jgi:hypothetical protein
VCFPAVTLSGGSFIRLLFRFLATTASASLVGCGSWRQ